MWKNWLNFKLKHRNAQKVHFIREIWCSNRDIGRFDEKLGDSWENRESGQVWEYQVQVKERYWGGYVELEHLWIDFFPFKNREILFGTSIGLKVFSNWLQRVEDLLSEVAASWDGMLILADDVNTIIIHLNISQFLIG